MFLVVHAFEGALPRAIASKPHFNHGDEIAFFYKEVDFQVSDAKVFAKDLVATIQKVLLNGAFSGRANGFAIFG